ncbi:FecR family protein [Aestuariibaculum suncheonense]|uniref:FecR family protein n=1 Tax=Aestuariibaculum suncheonense TaxID=1028745 RepID=A0A8J6U9Y7_9FLAO|nr:FecR family protein [Aestuariibaculum suncheonense]MBD0834598.1 FecR family protein [Aestuariibaculum suncheonense]
MTKLIYKYLDHKASEEEIEQLFDWIDASKENKKQFIALKTAWAITATSKTQTSETLKILKDKTIKQKTKAFTYLKYAAILVIALGIGRAIFNKPINKNTNEVILELSNGVVKHIHDNQENVLINKDGIVIGKQTDNEIIYNSNIKSEELKYNTIKIPFGKRFKVILSDSTIVHLNAGTTFRFPENFIASANRDVFLTGEAFFEVTKNEQSPFIVHSDKINIQVLGTKFNVSSYPNDASSHSELLEGSVKISAANDASKYSILEPNQQAKWIDKRNAFEVKSVNTYDHIAWVNGEIIFKDMPFSALCKKLERAYNVAIINKNKTLDNQEFSGAIRIEESNIETLFKLLQIDTPFEYSIKNNIIIIND